MKESESYSMKQNIAYGINKGIIKEEIEKMADQVNSQKKN